MKERFPNKRKNIKPELWFELIFWVVWPMPYKTAKKAANHSKEGPINATISKSGNKTF